MMTPDLAMRFLVWSSYYNGLEPKCGKSFARFKNSSGEDLFSLADIQRLDRVQEALFRCFDPPSVKRSVEQMKLAKERNESCPFSLEELNFLFGTVNK